MTKIVFVPGPQKIFGISIFIQTHPSYPFCTLIFGQLIGIFDALEKHEIQVFVRIVGEKRKIIRHLFSGLWKTLGQRH